MSDTREAGTVPAINGWTPEQTKLYYERKHADRANKARIQPPPTENHPRAVSKARGEQLKAEWRAIAAISGRIPAPNSTTSAVDRSSSHREG